MKFSIITSTHKARLLHSTLLLAIFLGLFGLFYSPSSCHHPPPPAGLDGAFALHELVPAQVDAHLFSGELSDLLFFLDGLPSRLASPFPDVDDIQSWEEAGASLHSPALAYLASGQLVILAWVDPEKRARIDDGFPVHLQREEHSPGFRRGAGWREFSPSGEWQRWMSTDGLRIAAGFRISEDAQPLDDRIWDLPSRFALSSHLRDFAAQDEQALLQGSLNGAALLRRLPAEAGAAALLRDQLATSLGNVYFRLHLNSVGDELLLHLFTPGAQAAPLSFDLGSARTSLPDIGGLARPGVLGILRLSAEPQALFSMIRSLLPPETGAELDELLHTLQSELLVDVEAKILENLTGQFAIVFYGIEDRFFQNEGLELLSSLVRLESTREALLIPISDRPQLEEYLNIFTQLSRGKLRRQVIRHTVQYAYFDDGALSWALILNDDYILFVDSAVAFDHASSWERNPSQLSGVLRERGLAELLDAQRGLGLYLDLSTLRSILDAGGSPDAARWLESTEALRIITDHQDHPDLTEVLIWLSHPFPSGDHP